MTWRLRNGGDSMWYRIGCWKFGIDSTSERKGNGQYVKKVEKLKQKRKDQMAYLQATNLKKK